MWHPVPVPSGWLCLSAMGRLWLAQGRIISPLLFCSTCFSTVLPPHFVQPFPVSHSSLLLPFVTFASTKQTTWSFSLHHRLTFRLLSTLCMIGAFACASLLVSAPPNLPPWSSARLLWLLCTSWRRPLALGPSVQVPGCCSLSPTLSRRLHIGFLSSRKDRLFHQARCWCLGDFLSHSFS